MEILNFAMLAAAAFTAGAINSIAGGGSLLSFPALLVFGVPAISANATNTAVVWPGTVSSSWAYRREFPTDRSLVLPLVLTSIAGGILGAAILVRTPPKVFQMITPYLILFATVLFAFRGWFSSLITSLIPPGFKKTSYGRLAGYLFQFAVATYGGYFGAGVGILMLASFGLMGVGGIHRMNALKTVLASVLNGIALLYFAWAGLIVWQLALSLGLCATAGGYLGARTAKRLPTAIVHRIIVSLGFLAAGWLLYKNLSV